MTKFDKLDQAFSTWYRTPTYNAKAFSALCEVMAEVFEGKRANMLYSDSRPGALRLYVTRQDYLGRDRIVRGVATKDGVQLNLDPLSGRINTRLLRQLDFLYDQV